MNQFQLQLQFRKSRAANQIGGFFVRFLGIWKRISQKTSSTMLRNSNRNWNSQLHNFLRSIQRRFGFQIDPAGFVDIRKNIHFRKLKAIQFFRSNDERVAVAAQFRSNCLFGRRKLPCPYGRVVGSPRWAAGVPGEPRGHNKERTTSVCIQEFAAPAHASNINK